MCVCLYVCVFVCVFISVYALMCIHDDCGILNSYVHVSTVPQCHNC